MAESIVTDWLSDYAALESSEVRTFAAEHEHNHEIAHALFTILNERLKYPDLLHSICNQLYSFYRSADEVLRKFTLQFVPTLIYIYLNSVAQGDKKSCRSVETLLISIYNIEISCDDGQPRTVSFRMPILAQPSVYHEEKSLNASDLRRWEENSNKEVTWGPLQQVESLNAQNRLKVMTALLFVYNQQLCLIAKSALAHLCRVASQLVTQGFAKAGHAHRSSYGSDPNTAIVPKPLPRIPMSSQFQLELLHAVYFAMFNDFGSLAIQTVDDIHHRACYDLQAEVILVTNAIKNSLHANPSGQPSDGPMGISVALTPATTTVTISKSMITNASFRTKKLPDDIPIQGPNSNEGGQTSSTGGGSTSSNTTSAGTGLLVSISEEMENEPRLSGGSKLAKDLSKLHNKVPFPAFKKSKDKEAAAKAAAAAAANGSITSGDAGKDSVTVKSSKKEKFSNRVGSSSNMLIAADTADSSGASDKTSPTTIITRKNSQLDMGSAAAAAAGEPMIAMQPMLMHSNGADTTADDSLNSSSLDVPESLDDSSPDAPSQRTSIIIGGGGDILKGHMQVSQV